MWRGGAGLVPEGHEELFLVLANLCLDPVAWRKQTLVSYSIPAQSGLSSEPQAHGTRTIFQDYEKLGTCLSWEHATLALESAVHPKLCSTLPSGEMPLPSAAQNSLL